MMEENLAKTYEYLVDALRFCASDILTLEDDELASTILEELDLASISDMHENSLDFLMENSLIDNQIKTLILELREKIRYLLDRDEFRTIESFRTDREWDEVYKLSDEIMRKLK